MVTLDWTPLCPEDPVPGDSVEIDSFTATCKSTAEEITQQIAALKRLAGQTDWVGLTADAYRSKATDVTSTMTEAGERYTAVYTALHTWSPQLGEHQSAARALLTQAEGLQSQLQSANTPVVRPANPTPAQTKQFAADDAATKTTVDGLNDQLDGLHAALKVITDARDQDAHAAASAISTACDDGLKDHHSIWGSIEGWFSGGWHAFSGWVASHAALIKEIATAASWIGTALAFIAPFCGPLAPFVFGAAMVSFGVAFVGHSLLAITGNGSWTDAAMDLFSMVTLGKGHALVEATEEGLVKITGKEVVTQTVTQLSKDSSEELANLSRVASQGGKGITSVAAQNAQRVFAKQTLQAAMKNAAAWDAVRYSGAADLKTVLSTGDITAGRNLLKLKVLEPLVGSGGKVGDAITTISNMSAKTNKLLTMSWATDLVGKGNQEIDDQTGVSIIPEIKASPNTGISVGFGDDYTWTIVHSGAGVEPSGAK